MGFPTPLESCPSGLEVLRHISGGAATGGTSAGAATGGFVATGGAAPTGGNAATGGASANPCSPNPCINGGTCSPSGSSYACVCAAGYKGTNCQTLIDNCTPNPCQNAGICVNGINTYTCQCSGGYGGLTCNTPVYTALQIPANLTNCLVAAISGDCGIAVGQCTKSVSAGTTFYQAVKWNTSTGAASLLLPYATSAQAIGVNSDGSLIVGNAYLDNLGATTGGVIWTSPSAAPTAINQASYLNQLSANGEIAVGATSAGAGAYWDVTNILTSGATPVSVITLTTEAAAAGVSNDGSVVVGTATQPVHDGTSTAVRWTAAAGAVSLANYSACSAGTPCSLSNADGVSGDGNVTFGTSSTFSSGAVVRWVGTGAPQLLESPDPNLTPRPYSSNFDGSIIVGANGSDGFIWDLKSGNLQSLSGVLATIGVALPTAPSIEAVGICNNGTVVIGNSISDTSIPWAVNLTNTGVAGL